MEWYEAVILGLVQGLTEFLPVSSSGHLVIGREILGVEESGDLVFEVAVHAATVLSTIVVFRHQIWNLLKGLFKFSYNDETDYILKICVSMIPVFIVGVFFKDLLDKNTAVKRPHRSFVFRDFPQQCRKPVPFDETAVFGRSQIELFH